jgi:hypothetical protein
MMKAWLGHYLNKPSAWFLVLAPTRAEAELLADSTTAEPDLQSLRPICEEALFEFHAYIEPVQDGSYVDFGMGPSDGILIGEKDSQRIRRALESPPLPRA